MILTALADVNDSSENEKMSIAKFLTVSFAVLELQYQSSLLDCVFSVNSLHSAGRETLYFLL